MLKILTILELVLLSNPLLRYATVTRKSFLSNRKRIIFLKKSENFAGGCYFHNLKKISFFFFCPQMWQSFYLNKNKLSQK